MKIKRDIVLDALKDHDVFLHINARSSGVVVPKEHVDDRGVICLQLGFSMVIPMESFQTSAFDLEVVLSFRGQPRACRVPWHAIFHVSFASKKLFWPEACDGLGPLAAPDPAVDNVVRVDFARRRRIS